MSYKDCPTFVSLPVPSVGNLVQGESSVGLHYIGTDTVISQHNTY